MENVILFFRSFCVLFSLLPVLLRFLSRLVDLVGGDASCVISILLHESETLVLLFCDILVFCDINF